MSKKVIYSLLILLVYYGCDSGIPYVSPELKPYIEEYNKEFNTNLDIPVVLTILNNSINGNAVVATCVNKNIILVNNTEWSNMKPYEKRAVLLHEIGHCIYYLPHDNTEVNGKSFSIMHQYLLNELQSENDYIILKDRLKEKLCQKQ